ncbi:MAG: flagellar biosynthesis protein FlhB [Eubacteriales bacterium]
MPDKESRTEKATPKRLRDARKKGQVVKSGDLNSAASFFLFTLSIGVLGQYLFSNTLQYLRNALTIDYTFDVQNAGVLLINNISYYFVLILPFFIIAVVLAIITNLIQVGFMFTLEPLKPDFKKLNPIEGFKNIFSVKSLFNLVKNLMKLIVVLFITYLGLSQSYKSILNTNSIGTEKLFGFFINFVKDISFNIAIVMLGIAIVDYIFQRREYLKNLRMTKQEIKDEYKEMEGNPQIKSLRQQKQRQLAMNRMMSSIKTADVVITNPTHIAVVLRYHAPQDKAPIVVAKGVDLLAEKIRNKATEHNIPIIENKPLAQAMYKKVELGDYVPVDLYKAIAEILAIVYQMRQRRKRSV